MNDRPLLFSGPAFEARALTPADAGLVDGLFSRCDDYFDLVDGGRAADEAARLFREVPEAFDRPDDKIVAGLFVGSRLVGVLDALRDYPGAGRWALGLLLIEPETRGRGFGASVFESFARWCAAQGGATLRLGCVEQNAKGLAFWRARGFETVEVRAGYRHGARTHRLHVMELTLG